MDESHLCERRSKPTREKFLKKRKKEKKAETRKGKEQDATFYLNAAQTSSLVINKFAGF
jgi:hypothetical protein